MTIFSTIRSRFFTHRSLSRKVLTTSGLIGAFCLLVLGLYLTNALRAELIRQNDEQINNLAHSVRHGLHAIMLTGNANIAQKYAQHLKKTEGVTNLQILRTDGSEAFQKNRRQSPLLSGQLQTHFRQAVKEKTSVSFVKMDETLNREKNFFIPIPFEEGCQQCHTGTIGDVRGVLEITVSLAAIDSQVKEIMKDSLLIILISLCFFVLILGLALHQILTSPLEALTASFQQVARGKLTDVVVDLKRKDEIGLIGHVLDQLTSGLEERIRKINLQSGNMVAFIKEIIKLRNAIGENTQILSETSSNVTTENSTLGQEISKIKSRIDLAANNVVNISQGTEVVSKNTAEISESLLQTNRSVNEMTKLVEQMEQNLGTVWKTLEDSNKDTAQLATSINKMTSSLGAVREKCQRASQDSQHGTKLSLETLDLTQKLTEASREIDQVTTLIMNVAEETHMLGLNALIEAASAGEAGKGFAVVANEIKDLSQRTLLATEKISTVLQRIQDHAHEVSVSVQKISKTINTLDQTNQWIHTSVESQDQAIQDISQATKELTTTNLSVTESTEVLENAATAISQAVVAVRDQTESMSLGAKKAADSAEQIDQQSRESRDFLLSIHNSIEKTDASSQRVQEKMAMTNRVVHQVQSSVHHLQGLSEVAAYLSDALLSSNTNMDIGPEPFDIRQLKEPLLAFLGSLEEVVSGVSNQDRASIQTSCLLCGWIEEKRSTYGSFYLFEKLITSHAQLHKTADEIFDLTEQGLIDPEARSALRFFREVRRTLFDHLNHLYLGQEPLQRGQPLIQWQASYQCGHLKSDQEHQQLVTMANDLFSGTEEGSMRHALIQFLDVARQHFTQEEHYLQSEGSPELAWHTEQNRHFINHMEQALFLHEREDFQISLDLFLFLREWLLKHMTGQEESPSAP
ncbi:MAG: HAMP domain-containing protein [Magnetococcales bacterium]|nr:HAMP domain-containing protein [Magnetococcales bacterium]